MALISSETSGCKDVTHGELNTDACRHGDRRRWTYYGHVVVTARMTEYSPAVYTRSEEDGPQSTQIYCQTDRETPYSCSDPLPSDFNTNRNNKMWKRLPTEACSKHAYAWITPARLPTTTHSGIFANDSVYYVQRVNSNQCIFCMLKPNKRAAFFDQIHSWMWGEYISRPTSVCLRYQNARRLANLRPEIRPNYSRSEAGWSAQLNWSSHAALLLWPRATTKNVVGRTLLSDNPISHIGRKSRAPGHSEAILLRAFASISLSVDAPAIPEVSDIWILYY